MPLEERMDFRVDNNAKTKFTVKCQTHNREPAEMLREIIDAFNEGRLRISIPKSKAPKNLEIYNVTRNKS